MILIGIITITFLLIERFKKINIFNLVTFILAFLNIVFAIINLLLFIEAKTNLVIILIFLFVSFMFFVLKLLDFVSLKRNKAKDENHNWKLTVSFSVLLVSFYAFIYDLFLLFTWRYYLRFDSSDGFFYETIGKILFLPISGVLFISSLVFLLTHIFKVADRKINYFIPLIVITSIWSLYAIIALPSTNAMAKEYSYFTVEKWEKANCPQRKYLIKDFFHQYDVNGWSKDKMTNYLGLPDKIENPELYSYAYLYKLEEIKYNNGNNKQIEYELICFSDEEMVAHFYSEIRYENI